MILDKGKVTYAESEKGPGEVTVSVFSYERQRFYGLTLIQVSGAEATLAKL